MGEFLKKRGKGVLKADYGSRDIYKHYLSIVNPKSFDSKFFRKSVVDDFKIFKAILKDYFEEWRNQIILESEDYPLPTNMGSIRILKIKMRFNGNVDNLPIDFAHYQKTGKKIKITNDHRQNFLYKIKWFKEDMKRLRCKSFYYFLPVRQFKRDVAAVLKSRPDIDYLEVHRKIPYVDVNKQVL